MINTLGDTYGHEKLALEFSNLLLDLDVFLTGAIRYLKLSAGALLTALYGGHQLKYAIDCIESIGRELMKVRVSKVSFNG